MAAPIYRVHNGPSPTTSAAPKVAVANGSKTMLQLLHPNNAIRVIEWGVDFDGTSLSTPIVCELIHTTTVAATVTAYVANDVTLLSDPLGNTPGLTLSTSGSGYTATAEGSVVAPVRVGDRQDVAPTNQYVKQFPLGQEFVVPAGGILRVRITGTGTSPNCSCYVVFSVG
jgi:hypothetical protein